MSKQTAKIISQALDPTVMWPLMIVMALLGTGLSSSQLEALVIPVLLLELILPIGLLVLFIQMKWVSDWEITNRAERGKYFITIVALHVLSVGAYYYWGNDFAWQFRLLLWVIQLVGTGITLFWKISIHTAAFGAAIFTLGYFFGAEWWWLYLLAPVLMWSRVARKKHTWMQTIAGLLATSGMLWLGLTLL